MTLRGIALAILAGVLGMALGCGAATPAAPEATSFASPAVATIGHEVGDHVPDFEMTLADGSTVTSVSLLNEGKPVFLFFMTTW